MNDSKQHLQTAFDVAAQVRGLDAAKLSDTHWRALKSAFKRDSASISDHLHDLSFLLRIDGILGTFNCKEAELPKVNRREKWASVDIGIPVSEWKDKTDLEIARYISGAIRLGLDLVLELCKKRKIEVPDVQTRERLEACLKHYLAQFSN